jgi:IS30 family transposase
MGLARDQGRAMAQQAPFTLASGTPGHFWDPRSPWRRGSDENTIPDELNERPRQALGRMTA